MKSNTIKIFWILLFSIAMGYLESAVVIYIRELYYPEGFAFPMKLISEKIMITEFFREAATMLMLLGTAIIAGRNAIERFAYFIMCFGIWDIFYYVFLYLILGWPQSLLTWDVLFFIPLTWIGPVLAPVINSATMIFLAAVILFFKHQNGAVKTGMLVWTLLIVGSLVVIVSYTMDYAGFMSQRFSIIQQMGWGNTEGLMEYALSYIPRTFNWWVFFVGLAMHITAILFIMTKNMKNTAGK
ncbi:MAG TPA: hypothetical protein PLI16_01190 [Bacteroidales bacterium]|jgi:hypothetical protein|nr:hypothetical protein [Bacteroidales bacterium]HNZ43117.1 hypothetical protein [Bacteroidales bacterium]HOH83204.1 hypothetical protein [Bacteroidales bacterium]HPI29136.1 hypothetical protein [Bacteroidales bacterium]